MEPSEIEESIQKMQTIAIILFGAWKHKNYEGVRTTCHVISELADRISYSAMKAQSQEGK